MIPTEERASISHISTHETSLIADFISPPDNQDLMTLIPIRISTGIDRAMVNLSSVCVNLTKSGGFCLTLKSSNAIQS